MPSVPAPGTKNTPDAAERPGPARSSTPEANTSAMAVALSWFESIGLKNRRERTPVEAPSEQRTASSTQPAKVTGSASENAPPGPTGFPIIPMPQDPAPGPSWMPRPRPTGTPAVAISNGTSPLLIGYTKAIHYVKYATSFESVVSRGFQHSLSGEYRTHPKSFYRTGFRTIQRKWIRVERENRKNKCVG